MSSLTEGDNADNTAAAATAVSTEITSDASDISSTSTSLDNSRINAPHPSESSEADTLALMAEEVQSAQKDSIPPLVHEFVDSSNSAPAIPSASDNDHAQHIQQQQRQQEQLFEIENSTLPLDLSSSVDASSSSTDPPQNETATPAAVALLVSKDEQQQQQQQQHQNSTPNGNDDDEEDDEEYTSEYQPTILEDEEESEQANEEKVQSAIDRVFKAAIPSSNDTEDGDEKFVDTSSAVLSPPVIDIGALILDSATTNSTDGSAPPELNHLAQLNSTSESDHRVYTALKNGTPIHSDGSAHAPILPIGTYNELNHNTIQKDVEATAAETAVADALSGTRKLSQVAKYGVAPSAIEEAYTVIHATASLANSPMKQKIAAAISTTRNSIVRSKNSSRVSSAEHSRRLSGVGDGGGGGGGHSRRGSFLGFIRITDNETGEDGFAEFSRESTTALEGRRASQYRHTRSRSSATLKESVSEMGVPLISYSPTNRTRLIPAKYVAEGESNIPRYVMSKKKATPSMNCGADETGSETGYTKDIGTATSTATAVAASSNARPTFAKDRPMSSGKDKKLDGIVQKGKTVVSETKMMEMIKTDTIASSNNNEKGAGASSKKGHLVTVITKSGLQTEFNETSKENGDELSSVLPKGLGNDIPQMGPNFPYHGRRPITKWLRKKYNVLDDNLSISKRKLKPASPPKMADNPVADTSAESDHEQQRHEEGGEAIHPSIFGAKAEFMSQYSKPIPLVRLSGDAFAQKEPARRYRLIRELRARREIALQAEYLGITSIPAKTFLVRHHHHQVLQGMGTMRAVNDPPKNSDLQEFGREPMDTVISNHQPTIASLLAGEISQSLVPTFNESKPSYETYSHLGKVGISAVAELDEAKFMERSHYTPPQNQAEIMEKLRLRKKDTCLIAHQQRRIIHPMKMPELQAKLHIKDLPLVIKRTGKKGAVKH